LEADADLNSESEDGKKKSAIHLAAGMGYADCTLELIARGIDCLAVDSEGMTPYQLAVHMQTDKAFKNERGSVSQDEWATIAQSLSQAVAMLERLLAKQEFAEEGIQKLQAAVRGSMSRKVMNSVLTNKEYPFLISVDCANGLYINGATGKASANPICVVTVHDGNNDMQLYTFKTNTVRGEANPKWNATFLCPGARTDCTLTFTLFDSVKSGGRKDFLGQAVYRLKGVGAMAVGKHTLVLENMADEFKPRHEANMEFLPFNDSTLPLDKCPCFGATLEMEIVQLNSATSACALLKHNVEKGGFEDRWVVLAGQQLEVYERKGMAKPSQTIKLQPKRRKMSMAKGFKTHEVEQVEFKSQVLLSEDELIDVKEQVLQVIDQEGIKWYFKDESPRTTALWQWKIEMALAEDPANSQLRALDDTRRCVHIFKTVSSP
jgi:hypothetical protein